MKNNHLKGLDNAVMGSWRMRDSLAKNGDDDDFFDEEDEEWIQVISSDVSHAKDVGEAEAGVETAMGDGGKSSGGVGGLTVDQACMEDLKICCFISVQSK